MADDEMTRQLLDTLHELPREQVRQVMDFALFLKSRYGVAESADVDDSWNEDDLHDVTKASVRNLEGQSPE